MLPPNCYFVVLDYVQIPLPPSFRSLYNLIRCTRLNGRVHDWTSLCSKMFNDLRPGGYVEVYDISRFHGTDFPAWDMVPALFRSFGVRNHRPFDNDHHIHEAMHASGFIRIAEKRSYIVLSIDITSERDLIKGLVEDVVHILQLLPEVHEDDIRNYSDALMLQAKDPTLEGYKPSQLDE